MKNNGEIVSDEVLTKPESEESVTDNVSTNPDLEKNLGCALALFSALNPKNICNNIRAKREEKRQKREQEEQEQKEKALQKAAERKERYRKYKAFVDQEVASADDYGYDLVRCFLEGLEKIENMKYDPYDITEEFDSLEEKKKEGIENLKRSRKEFWGLHIESLQFLYGYYEINRINNLDCGIYCGNDRITNPYFYRFPSDIINLLKKYGFTYGFTES